MKIKILQLNVWTGRIKGNLLRFFQNNQFDIICLQEAVWTEKGTENGQKQIENFAVTVEMIKEAAGLPYEIRGANWGIEIANGEDRMSQGNVILSRFKFAKTEVKTICGDYDAKTIFATKDDPAYTVLTGELENGLVILNYHGYWEKSPVGDETTIEMMKRAVADLPKNNERPVVMCGDLNVIHESPAMREVDFLRDLTDEYKVDNTLAGLKFDGKVPCDHILINALVKENDFHVVEELVSDHKGLTAELEF